MCSFILYYTSSPDCKAPILILLSLVLFLIPRPHACLVLLNLIFFCLLFLRDQACMFILFSSILLQITKKSSLFIVHSLQYINTDHISPVQGIKSFNEKKNNKKKRKEFIMILEKIDFQSAFILIYLLFTANFCRDI